MIIGRSFADISGPIHPVNPALAMCGLVFGPSRLYVHKSEYRA
jgi:hypothetical protein